MPTINITGAGKESAAPTVDIRGLPMMDALKWNRALNGIERATAKLVQLQMGTATAVGGIRLPVVFRQMERDLRRLIVDAERTRRSGGYAASRVAPPGSPAWPRTTSTR